MNGTSSPCFAQTSAYTKWETVGTASWSCRRWLEFFVFAFTEHSEWSCPFKQEVHQKLHRCNDEVIRRSRTITTKKSGCFRGDRTAISFRTFVTTTEGAVSFVCRNTQTAVRTRNIENTLERIGFRQKLLSVGFVPWNYCGAKGKC